jgi:hypothetical protein
MKGHAERCEGLEAGSDIDLWSTCGTNAYVRKVVIKKPLKKIEDLFACGWESRCGWTFINCVYNDIQHWYVRKFEDFD